MILVDDGSRDGTTEEARKYFASLPRVTLLQHSRNKGPGAAVRTGFASATGDIICTIDSDCTFDPLRSQDAGDPGDPQSGHRYRFALPSARRGGERAALASPAQPRRLRPVPPYLQLQTVHLHQLHAGLSAPVIDTVSFEGDGFAAFTEILLRAAHQGYKVAELPEVLNARLRNLEDEGGLHHPDTYDADAAGALVACFRPQSRIHHPGETFGWGYA